MIYRWSFTLGASGVGWGLRGLLRGEERACFGELLAGASWLVIALIKVALLVGSILSSLKMVLGFPWTSFRPVRPRHMAPQDGGVRDRSGVSLGDFVGHV